MEIEIATNTPVNIYTTQDKKSRVQGWKFPKMEQGRETNNNRSRFKWGNVGCTTEFRLIHLN